MNARFSAALLAATMGAAGLLLPAAAQAALVGHQTNCSYNSGDTAAMILAAGHTPVAVATVDATSLSGLAAFVYEQCDSNYVSGAAVDAAVANGMVLVTHPWSYGYSVSMPGGVSPVMIADQTPMVLPLGSPALTGPGGALSTARSYVSYPQGFFQLNTLPPGSVIVATSDSYNDHVVAFAYDHGRGRVVASTVALNYFLLNGSGQFEADAAHVRAYASNLVAWAVGPAFTSCAAEGYIGSKLTLCRQVCEIDQTPTRLLSLIKLFKTAYREDPPCAL